MGYFDKQVYQSNQQNRETRQIFTLIAKPGIYKFEYVIRLGINMYLKKSSEFTGFIGFRTIKSGEFEAKAGQIMYIGMLNIDATGKREGLNSIFAGKIRYINESWDPSAENIDFVREQIPELKDANIIHYPITVEFQK
jgi:hypothetical protein